MAAPPLPADFLRGDWDPADPDVERVRELAATLAGVGATT